jgi:large subunit ribosomal protein L19
MNVVEMIEKEQMRSDIPDFQSGDTVRVNVRIIEGQKQRIQAFEGVVIRKKTAVPALRSGRCLMVSV